MLSFVRFTTYKKFFNLLIVLNQSYFYTKIKIELFHSNNKCINEINKLFILMEKSISVTIDKYNKKDYLQ